jgi:hypothetical protein
MDDGIEKEGLEVIVLGSAPRREKQTGTIDDCLLFEGLMQQRCGPEPDGAYFHIAQRGEVRRTLTVVYDPASETGKDYAYQCKREVPENWDRVMRVTGRTRGAP